MATRQHRNVDIGDSETLYRNALDNLIEGCQIIGYDWRYLYVNEVAAAHGRRSKNELLGKTMMEMYPGIENTELFAKLRECMTKRTNHRLENEFTFPGGSKGWFSIHIEPVPEGVFILSVDISEEKKIDEELRSHRDHLERLVRERTQQVEAMRIQFQSFFESSPGLYLVLKPDFTIIGASDAYLRATMTKREDIVGKGIFDVFPDNPRDPSADGVQNLRSSLERVRRDRVADTMAVQRYDIRKPASEGGGFELRYWSPVNSPVFDADDNLEYIIHRVEDITEFVLQRQSVPESSGDDRLRKMEAEIFQRTQELQRLNQRLHDANKELEAFSYSVSHDLRAPLRHIAGFVDLLGKRVTGSIDETGRRYLDIIRDSARHMGALIDDLLVFSRMGRAEMTKSRISLATLAHRVRVLIEPHAQGRTVEWHIGELPEVEADPSMVSLVFQNLMDNAVKYTRPREKAVIEVGSNVENGEVVVWVRDNGVGFDMNYVGKLFDVFQRLHTQDEFEGTGIGLANVRRIIGRHGGRTWAVGETGKGATFYFSIPTRTNKV